ncbi:MAG TPA: hypothetical protein VH206_10845 [Xanthobacteraceae bacterium]|nr:hypothetical protein [Xanthobacteraceae bacterium]
MALALSSLAAQAQTPAPDTKNCASSTNSSGQNLSDKLSQSNGVICPPSNIDQGIRTPAPDTGKMPVISPPGSPGGNPSVQPK